MGRILAKLFKGAAYAIAGVVILLAIAVGLLRLFLPRLPEYQDQIKAWAGDAIGMDVQFQTMDARWGLSGPELEFIGAELTQRETGKRIIAADEVSISVALVRLVVEQTVAIDRVLVTGTSIDVYRRSDGVLFVQGGPVGELLPNTAGQAMPSGGELEVIGEDIELRFQQEGDQRPALFEIERVDFSQDQNRQAVDADINLPDSLGGSLELNALSLTDLPSEERVWDIAARADDLVLAGVTRYIEDERFAIATGTGDVELALALATDGIESAALSFDFNEVSREGTEPVSLSSDLEYRRDDDGWLLAGRRLRLSTAAGDWPESSFRIDTGLDADGSVELIDAQADYLNLADFVIFSPLLDTASQALLDDLAPEGVLRGLDATLSGLGTDALRYSISVDIEALSLQARDRLPGMSGISGQLRADDSGGRLRLASQNVSLSLDEFLSVPIELDALSGTVIWRRSGEDITVLSDNIAFESDALSMDTNVQLTLGADRSPVIDLASRWTVNDLAVVKRYIPQKVMHPNLYNWFQDALVSGRIENGRTTLTGELMKYPFDNGEGRFLLEGTVTDSEFKYLPRWPANQIEAMEVVLENTRLYTEKNFSVAEGRQIRDAKVEIADLREGILEIDGDTSGDMESLIAYAKASPIADLLGGALDRLEVAGNANTDLRLTVPLKDWRSFTFVAGVDTEDATVIVDGLKPPFTGINGRLEIEKEAIRAKDLTATFLGETISIELQRARADMSGYAVVATANGRVPADELASQFGIPADQFLSGNSAYQATALFPNGKDGQPFAIGIASDLIGMGIDLPAPFGKAADDELTMQGDIRLVDGGLVSAGRTKELAWNIVFDGEGGLQFDRGTLVLGDADIAPEAPTRGLHIAGDLSRFDLDEWLAMNQPGGSNDFVANIRSAEVNVGEFTLFGQRYTDQWLRLDRSARDWLIQVRGELAEGTITLPYEFTEETTLGLEMQRLVLPGDEQSEPVAEPVPADPRKFPAIRLRADEFGLGNRFVGRVEADIRRTPDGLVADRIMTVDPSFEIFATGSWRTDAEDPTGYRTTIVGGLKSSDIKSTMARLDYQPGINGDDLSVIADVGWSGGPRNTFLESIDGTVEVRFGAGQLDEIDPGAGRVVGLMSIVALPRRLSLDFSDVFQKGFAFDSIEGNFRLDDGDSYTCNLSLEGPAAAIAIVGRAGLDTQDYEQSAIVNANFGNSLPLGAAIVGGPQAAVAALILSQIFKQPLQDLTQVYYNIGGSWDEPMMASANAAAFAEKGQLAGCVADAEQE